MRKPGQQCGHPGYVAIVLPGLIGATQINFLDTFGLYACSLHGFSNDEPRQVIRPD